ncbi:CsgG/HfaB family protein [Litoreibacter sp.]|nr:CsgG/HfaB family protein [Litoreibacter sp.]
MKSVILGVAFSTMMGGAFAAESIDSSLDEMAAQIVQRTASDGGSNVGISTFTHSDGTCSQLSNYISEFIVDSLFNAGSGQIDIIERSQLSAIFREMELVYDATIAPDTARKLGEIAGVDALVTGSLIEFGEVVKVQARLISTKDGKLFATARSDFPMVGTVGKMMVERSRAACGFTNAKGAPVEAATPAATTAQAPSTGGVSLPSDAAHIYESDIFVAQISNAIYSATKGDMTVSMRVQNTSDKAIAVSYLNKSMSLSDGVGGEMAINGYPSGMRTCTNQPRFCTSARPDYASVVPPGKIGQLNFKFTGADKLSDPIMTMAFEMVITPDTDDTAVYDVRSINFLDIKPTVK